MKGRFGDFGVRKLQNWNFEAKLVEFRGENKRAYGLYHTGTIRTIDFNLTLMFA